MNLRNVIQIWARLFLNEITHHTPSETVCLKVSGVRTRSSTDSTGSALAASASDVMSNVYGSLMNISEREKRKGNFIVLWSTLSIYDENDSVQRCVMVM